MNRIQQFLIHRGWPLTWGAAGLCMAVAAWRTDFRMVGNPSMRLLQFLLVSAGAMLFILGVFRNREPVGFLGKLFLRFKTGGRPFLLKFVAYLLYLALIDTALGHAAFGRFYGATEFGWTVPADCVVRKQVEDTTGQFRDVENRYFKYGFKRWGDPATAKTKVFVIGDSYTQIEQVSNGEEWYAYLEKEFPEMEFFVYGGGGYGSLQEYLVLDRYWDQIRPDLVLWEVHDNDYTNNLYELDAMRYPLNNFGVRPFWERGAVVYRLPLPLEIWRRSSFTGHFLMQLFDHGAWIAAKEGWVPHVPDAARIQALQPSAFDVTLEILSLVKKRAGEVPVHLFSVTLPGEREERICRATGIHRIPGVGEYIAAKEKEGLELRVPGDGHWNRQGNALAAEKLIAYFKSLR